MPRDDEHTVFRPSSARWIVLGAWALCALNLVAFIVERQWDALIRAIPVVAFISLAVWALLGSPRVIVTASAVVLVNPMRTVTIPWNLIDDVQPGYSLALRTTRGTFRAWGAPGGTQLSGYANFNANEQLMMKAALPDDGKMAMSGLADPTHAGQSEALGAARTILQRMRLARAQPSTSGDARVEVRWKMATVVVLTALLVASVVALVVPGA